MTHSIGIDFGTTNSSIARVNGSGEIELARFPHAGVSPMPIAHCCLEQVKDRGVSRIKSWSGPAAIEEYLAAETKGRLIQSLKSFLTSRSLKSTDVLGRRLTVEDLIARILRDLREKAEDQFGMKAQTAVVGRPVRFVGGDKEEDSSFAEERLMAAFYLAGYENVAFELEPVAAVHYYASTLDHDELILIGNFGGGTSDFSLLHVGPNIRKRGRAPADLLGNSGVGLAGDAFDAKIVRNLVSPALGRGSSARSMKKVLPAVPNWVYAKLEHWHHLSFLRPSSVMNMLNNSKAAPSNRKDRSVGPPDQRGSGIPGTVGSEPAETTAAADGRGRDIPRQEGKVSDRGMQSGDWGAIVVWEGTEEGNAG